MVGVGCPRLLRAVGVRRCCGFTQAAGHGTSRACDDWWVELWLATHLVQYGETSAGEHDGLRVS